MLIEKGDKIHVIFRRQFKEDLRRHFAGEVLEATEFAAKAHGYVFIFETSKNEYVRRNDPRTRIISLIDSANIVNMLPKGVEIEDLDYVLSEDNRLVVSDGKDFLMDINEFGSKW